jgi:hypothetical protein
MSHFQGTDSFAQIQPDGAGKKIATEQFTQGADIVEIQRVASIHEAARNTYGESTLVGIGGTVTPVTYAADSEWRFLGIILTGDTDAIATIKFDGVSKYKVRTSGENPTAKLILPSPDPDAAGTTVTVEVFNNGHGTTSGGSPYLATFTVTLLGI